MEKLGKKNEAKAGKNGKNKETSEKETNIGKLYAKIMGRQTYGQVKECKKYNPLLFKIASWVESSDRSKAIEMIKTKRRAEFAMFMEDKNWVIIKTKDSFFNERYGKKVNE